MPGKEDLVIRAEGDKNLVAVQPKASRVKVIVALVLLIIVALGVGLGVGLAPKKGTTATPSISVSGSLTISGVPASSYKDGKLLPEAVTTLAKALTSGVSGGCPTCTVTVTKAVDTSNDRIVFSLSRRRLQAAPGPLLISYTIVGMATAPPPAAFAAAVVTALVAAGIPGISIFVTDAPASPTCPAGTFYANVSTKNTDRICSPCTGTTFSLISDSSLNATLKTKCSPLSLTCKTGTFFAALGNNMTDVTCKACSLGFFASSVSDAIKADDIRAECPSKVSTVCAAGQYLEASATTTSDASCKPCATGTFSALTSSTTGNILTACPSVTVCNAGATYANTAATTSSNAVCACAEGATSNSGTGSALVCTSSSGCSGNQYFDGSACVAISATCPVGKFYATAATTTTDRVCSDCSAGTFSAATTDSTSTGSVLTKCADVATSCPAGTFYATASSTTADAVCTSCTLGTNYNSDVINFALNSPGTPCTAVAVCGNGIASAATLTTDNTCVASP